MKVRLHCPQCAKDPEAWPIQRAIADLEETGIYRLTCRAGHDTAFCLQNFKFELLFDLGIQAIDDGYYREAVSAFASALERFHEFFIEVTLVGGGVTRETYDAAWKNVKNSSERQLGAFVLLYARDEGASPPVLGTRDTEFRNAVVHKGRFPVRDETIAFGRQVQEIIRSCLHRLRSRLDDDVQAMRAPLLADLRSKVPAGFRPFNLYLMAFISASDEQGSKHFDIEEQVDALRTLRNEP